MDTSVDWDGLEWVANPARSSDRETLFELARYGEVLEHEGRPLTDVRLVDGWQPSARSEAAPWSGKSAKTARRSRVARLAPWAAALTAWAAVAAQHLL